MSIVIPLEKLGAYPREEMTDWDKKIYSFYAAENSELGIKSGFGWVLHLDQNDTSLRHEDGGVYFAWDRPSNYIRMTIVDWRPFTGIPKGAVTVAFNILFLYKFEDKTEPI